MLIIERHVVKTETIETHSIDDGVSVCNLHTVTMSQDNLLFMGQVIACSDVQVAQEFDTYLLVTQ